MQRIWNRVDQAIYSVSSVSKDGVPNFNICTWASKVSMKPAVFHVAIDIESQTYLNIEHKHKFLLQLFGKDCKKYVRKFGYKSGKDVDKTNGLNLKVHNDFFYLPECLGFLELEVKEKQIVGDHCQYFCSVLKHKNLNSGEILRFIST